MCVAPVVKMNAFPPAAHTSALPLCLSLINVPTHTLPRTSKHTMKSTTKLKQHPTPLGTHTTCRSHANSTCHRTPKCTQTRTYSAAATPVEKPPRTLRCVQSTHTRARSCMRMHTHALSLSVAPMMDITTRHYRFFMRLLTVCELHFWTPHFDTQHPHAYTPRTRMHSHSIHAQAAVRCIRLAHKAPLTLAFSSLLPTHHIALKQQKRTLLYTEMLTDRAIIMAPEVRRSTALFFACDNSPTPILCDFASPSPPPLPSSSSSSSASPSSCSCYSSFVVLVPFLFFSLLLPLSSLVLLHEHRKRKNFCGIMQRSIQ